MKRKMTKYAMVRWSVLGLLSRRKGFKSRSVHVGFMAENVAKGHGFLRVLRFSPISIIQQMFHIHLLIQHKRYKILKFRASSSNTNGSTVAVLAISTQTNFFVHMKIPPSPPNTHTHTHTHTAVQRFQCLRGEWEEKLYLMNFK